MQARAHRYEAVLLDALGTLVRLESPWPLLVEQLRARHGIELSLEDAKRALVAEMSYYKAHHREGHDAASLTELRSRCADVLREQLSQLARLDRDTVTELLLDSLRFTPYADAAPALARLRGMGLRLAVVSNWDYALGTLLGGLGLGGMLDAIVTSAEVGASKPEAAIFEAALRRVGSRAQDTLFVGDSLETDIAGALASGIRAVLLDRAATAADNSEIERILSLAELPGLVVSDTAGARLD